MNPLFLNKIYIILILNTNMFKFLKGKKISKNEFYRNENITIEIR